MYHPLLDTFLVAADCGSFNKAAEELYLTPAAVMNQMNALEKHLSLRLFERSRQGLTLTAAGRSVYEDAKKLIHESELAVNRAREAEEAQAKVLRIGSSFLNPCQVFLDFWQQHAVCPGEYKFRIVPYSDDRNRILSVVRLLGREIDFLVGAFNSPRMYQLAECLPLGEYDLCIAMPLCHPLAGKEMLELCDLKGEHLIVPEQEKEGSFTAFMESQPEIMFEVQDAFYDLDTFNYCEQYNYLMLTSSAWSEVHPALKTVPVNWDLKMSYGLLYAKDAEPEVKRFITVLQTCITGEND